jgi:hypothetical protein
VREIGTGRLQQRGDVAHHLIGLRRDVAVDESARRGIETDLAGDEQEIARPDGGTVGTDRFRRVRRRNRLTRH